MGTGIFLAEDNERILRILASGLAQRGYIILTAASRQEGLKKIKKVKESGIEIAILDGSLGTSGYVGEDGQKIAEALRKEIPGIKIISFSGDAITWGDYNLRKSDGFNKLFEVIGILSQPKIKVEA